jgi:hypothetical protein
MTNVDHSISIFNTHQRYLRSANLERDWNDPSALENYVFTPQAQQSLERLSMGLRNMSSLRAWRITGDYGSGKSSFALLLANLFDKRENDIPTPLKSVVSKANALFLSEEQPRLLPLLITGSRRALGSSILEAIVQCISLEAKVHPVFKGLTELVDSEQVPSDVLVVEWVKKFQQHAIKNRKADGIAIVVDEAGKFLEFAAGSPDQRDIFLFQLLAELSARSGKNPIFIVTILHQGLSSYAERLTKSQQREWEKVAGRFEEILWHFPVDQIALLIASALDTNLDAVDDELLMDMASKMAEVIAMGWYGNTADKAMLQSLAANLYPIDPTVIPVLVKLFASFGQNERSLYTFLLGAEDFGLQDFVRRTEGRSFFKLHDLYDYARSTFGSRLAGLSYYWKAIDEVVSSFTDPDPSSIALLKSVGIINLINSDALVPSERLLLSATDQSFADRLISLRNRHIIHFRGQAGGYCVWPHTSVNLDDAYKAAKSALGTPVKDVKSLIRQRLVNRPLVARRHYIEKGSLRYFEVRYFEIDDLTLDNLQFLNADGIIAVPLCETLDDVNIATEFATSILVAEKENFLVVVPAALQDLGAYLDEVQTWEYIERTLGELRQDKFAREEVSRQLHAANSELQRHLETAIGITAFLPDTRLAWYYKGQQVLDINSGKRLMAFLTEICDNMYPLAPWIHNELINRRDLSAAASSARLRICERLFEFSNMPFLGMDPNTHPPEMSMYLSVLLEAGFHQRDPETDAWYMALPDAEYDHAHCNVLPAMERIHELLLLLQDERVPATTIIEALKEAPYGVKAGMIPLLIAVFAVINEQGIAFYEDGSFIPRITGSNFHRLIKDPESFEIQYYPISTIRESLFKKLVQELGFQGNGRNRVDLLDVIRPLIVFMSGLPDYVSNTNSLTPQTQKVRNLIRTTKDPVKLLFKDLPVAFGMEPIIEDRDPDPSKINDFVNQLKLSVDELRACYPELLEKMRNQLAKEFELDGSFEANREAVAQRAKSLSSFVTELRLKSYCLRLADTNLSLDLWTESLANLICSMPATKWREKDLYKFEQEIHKLTQQFFRVEATLYKKTDKQKDSISVRVALTRPDGQERDQVVHLSATQAMQVEKLESELELMLQKHGQLGIAAASGVLWKMMTSNGDETDNL